MDSIPQEIIQIIFSFLPISGKRRFIRTCHAYHQDMEQSELEFQKKINDTKYFFGMRYTGFSNQLYKYTIELFYDNYPIPNYFIIPENRVLHQYKKIYYKTAKRGDLDLIKKLLALNRNNYLDSNIDWTCYGAAKVGNLAILRWMKLHYKFDSGVTAYAARGNQFNVLKWLRKYEAPWDFLTTAYAAKSGNIKMLKWCLDNGCKINEYSIQLSASKGHFNIVKFLYKKYLGDNYYHNIGASGNLEIVEWIIGKLSRYESKLFYQIIYGGAAENGKLHVLKWLKNNNVKGYNKNKWICKNAAIGNQLDCLKWARENGNPWNNAEMCKIAARNGNLEMFEWLISNGCIYSGEVSKEAANYGNLNILEWIKEKGYALDNICGSAAWGGHLEIVKWGVENHCKLNCGVISSAATNGHLEIIKWARSQGCGWNSDACAQTVVHNHLDILKWLRLNGCPWDEDVCTEAIYFNNIDILRWAIKNGCPCGEKTYLLSLDKNEMIKNVQNLDSREKKSSKILNYLKRKINEGIIELCP
jgi:hypothetical protein